MATARPVVLLAFADDREPGRHLRNLRRERQELERAWMSSGAFEVVVKENATLDDIAGVFQANRGRVVLFHYAGHAESYGLLLHAASGESTLVGTDLAGFLGRQRGLRFVFLNACSTAEFVEALISAGVPAVAGTSLDVDDEVATGFAVDFYRGLATEAAVADGATLDRAFADAESLARARLGHAARDTEALVDLESLSDEERHVRVAYRASDIVQYQEEATRYVREWPWALRSADDEGRRWTLGDAIADPYFGLPDLPDDIRLPREPFRYLNWFQRDHARVFFGRGADIRTAYRWVTEGREPLMLLYGQSGVGKSSFLEAGLLPRLEAGHDVRYLRRDPEVGLLSTLAEDLGCEPGAEPVSKAWREVEEASGDPLVVVLDQVEEAYTVPISGGDEELAELIEGVRGLFGASSSHPRGRLIFGFRKEWLAEVEAGLDLGHIEWRRVFLQRLDRAGIIEVVRGISSTPGLRSRYGLSVDATLPEIIADDLLEDAEAALSPTLQILLTKMWASATDANEDEPAFTRDLYWGLKKQGLLLSDFLDDQLETLATIQPDASESGLDLDVLSFHTTAMGTARKRTLDEVGETYRHLPDVLPSLLRALESLHVLQRERRSRRDRASIDYRLAHDTLAPIVRNRFDLSQKAGPRLLRALEARVQDWRAGGEGSLLGPGDLAILEVGRRGMRALSDDEERLVDASQTRLERDRRLVGLAESRALAAWGHRSLELGDLAAAAAFAFAALTRAATDEAQRLAHQVLDSPGRCLAVATGTDAAAEAMFSRDGSLVVTAGANGVAHIWAADSGILLDTLGRERQGFRVALSPDRYRVLVADEGGRPQVCSVETRETLAVLPWEDLDGNLAPPSTASLTFAAFSPRGWTLLTTWEWDEDEWAPGSEVWATDKGRRLAMLGDMGGEAVGRAAFSPDGRQWLTGHARGGNVRAWDLSWTHYQFEPFVASRAVTDCEVPFAFGPDGRCFLAAVRGGAALIRDFADLERRPLPSAGGEPAPLPDGASFPWGHRFYDPDASGGLGTADMGVEGAPLDPPAPLAVLSGHGAEILDLAFSPDGERVATGSEDGTARIWSTASGESMHVLRGHRDVVLTVCFSPDGDRLVTGGGDGTARVWSVTTGEEVAVLRGQPTRFVRPSFSPDGARVAAARGDSLRIWAVSPAESSVELRANQGAVFAARFEGDAVVTLSENREARRWSVEDGRTLDHIDAGPGRLWGAVLGPGRNGGALTWSEGGVLLWSESAFVPVHGLESVGGPDLGVVFHPDGDRYLAHYEMVVWVGFRDTPDVEAVGIHSDSGRILSAAFSEDGRRVITAGDDGTVRIWATIPASGDLIDAELVAFEAPGGSIAFAACDPGGRWVVTASDQGVASVLATESGEWVSTLGEHDEGLTRAVFSPDARRLLTVTTGGTVRVWDPATGELCAMFRRPGEVVGYASFSPDGQRVVTGSRDGTVRIWTALGQSLMLLRGHSAGITHAAFSDDGRSLVTSSNDGTARVWKVLDRDELLERVRLAVPRGLTPAELPEQLSETERSEVLRGSETGPQPARFQ